MTKVDINIILRRKMDDLAGTSAATPAITLENDETWTYEELSRRANRYANALRTLGVEKGDRVGILLFNCLEYYALYFAIVQIGAIAVRINFRLKSSELEYIISNSDCRVLCLHSELAKEINPVRPNLPVKHYVSMSATRSTPVPAWCKPWSTLEEGMELDVEEEHGLDHPAMLMYTSGTTGLPKGALWTHGNTLWFSSMQVMQWKFDSSTVIFPTGPQYHVGALEDLALPTLSMGGRVVVLRSGKFNIENVISIIQEQKVTHTLLFPFAIYELLRCPNLSDYDLSSLQVIYTGGDPLSTVAIESLLKKLPNVQLEQMYGLTEGTPIVSTLDGKYALEHPDSAGRPLPLAEIKIVDPDGDSVLPKGQIGEVCTHSPAVAIEYWQNPKATAETFNNGWCRTGDLGRITEDGFLVITGRKKDMIRSGGENIYPTEIENVIARHPKVHEVAVIGVPDEKYLETVCAVVVPHTGESITTEEIIEYCTSRLAGYKKPRHVVFMTDLPRTPSQKVQKFILRQQFTHLGEEDLA